MPKDKWQYAHEAWKKENMARYVLRISKKSKADMVEHIEKHRPANTYLNNLVQKDMDIERKFAICMGVSLGAEMAHRHKWSELERQLADLAYELGRELGLTPDEVQREAHQAMEREQI